MTQYRTLTDLGTRSLPTSHTKAATHKAHGVTGPDLAQTVEQLRPLTIQAIVTGFQRAANRIIRQSLDAD